MTPVSVSISSPALNIMNRSGYSKKTDLPSYFTDLEMLPLFHPHPSHPERTSHPVDCLLIFSELSNRNDKISERVFLTGNQSVDCASFVNSFIF
jgi:hypothetical protein